MPFVNLHVHSEYSLLDGACRIKDMVKRAKDMGQTALAVTDHGNMYAAVDFYNECTAAGIKPIIGCEVYVAPRTRFDKVFGADSHPYHLILLCKNDTGYKNLIKMVSLGYTEGFYSKPRIDLDLIKTHSEGLICLSACIAGEIPRKILSGDIEGAKETALLYNSIFGQGNFFLEVQNHKLPEDAKVLPALYRLSDETGIPLAATNDAHYIRREDAKVQRILLAIQTNSAVSEEIPIAFPNDEFYLKSEEEMSELFKGRPDAVENTAKIAEMCSFEMEFGKIKLPAFDADKALKEKYGDTNQELLRNMCREGLEKRYGSDPSPETRQRLEYELDVVVGMGYTDYYLIVWDFINFAKKNGIPVGPGRGSGAGSIAAYCIGITDIDPIKYQLIFERFLNRDRVSMPDFDVDFCYERRQEVIDYVVERYGQERVCQIVTFGTMAAKAAVRDVARVMELPYALGDSVSKLIPQSPHMTLDKALEDSPELRELYDSDSRVKEMIDTARSIEGMPRNTSTHAAGVVICDAPVSDYVPLMKRDDVIAAQYTMTALDKVGILKFDFLGLRNLTVIRDCEKAVRRRIKDFSVDNIPYDDPETFELLSKGDTIGVFQFESEGMTQLLTKLRPRSIEDLSAALSLFRPGPMDSIPRYLDSRRHPEHITYAHPMLENILDVTCGCIVYQEQVMEICRRMAGYSYGQADIVRRAMSKKKAAEMEKERGRFISGAVSNGVDEDTANGIFDELAGFAAYAFNKSHSAAYSVVAYQTAYLKCHYFKEYMAALMTAFTESTGKVMEFISYCRKRGVNILRPDINESGMGFTSTDEGIRFSLLAAKNLGRGVISSIIAERKSGGAFKGLSDLIKRMKGREFSRRCAESLIRCGALDGLGLNRRQMIESYDLIAGDAAELSRGVIEGQLDFFGMSGESMEVSVPYAEEYPLDELLEMEKEILGIYISGHPLETAACLARALRLPDIRGILSMAEGEKISLVCTIESLKPHIAKNGSQMAFAGISDMTGEMEAVIFPQVYAGAAGIAGKGKRVFIEGKTSLDRDGGISLLCDRIIPEGEFISGICSRAKLFIRCDSHEKDKIDRCIALLSRHRGQNPVIFRFADISKSIAHRQVSTTEVSPALIKELWEIVGEDNAAITAAGE